MDEKTQLQEEMDHLTENVNFILSAKKELEVRFNESQATREGLERHLEQLRKTPQAQTTSEELSKQLLVEAEGEMHTLEGVSMEQETHRLKYKAQLDEALHKCTQKEKQVEDLKNQLGLGKGQTAAPGEEALQ